MKNHLLGLLWVIPFLTIAQTYTETADDKFQLLNKSHIKSQILYDRVYPMAELVDFNQQQTDTSHVNHFYNAWAELQTADYQDRWGPVAQLKTYADQTHAEGQITLGIIHTDFEVIDEQALEDNLLQFIEPDSILADVPNRPQSPYLRKNALVVSPLVENSNSTSVTFTTSPKAMLLAADPALDGLRADFGNGEGYRQLPLYGDIHVNFPEPGLYHIKFQLKFTNGTQRQTYAKIRINAQPYIPAKSTLVSKAQQANCMGGTIMASQKFQGYDESQSYEGVGEYAVFEGGNAFDRPVIVLDGFDPDEGGENKTGVDLIVEKFLKYSGGNLGEDLRNEDFDIVPLNFIKYRHEDGRVINGGTDYIERNAMVLVELIQRVNSCKEGNFPIKVIGFSMGGLVARYALRYMELNNIPHHTDLFISVDSPHKGAVVPIGLQELADVIDDILPFGLGNPADDLMHTPAAKQMLIHHHLANSEIVAGAPNFHDHFYGELEAMGFPQQSRNIAVVNGTADGTAINNPGSKYLDGELESGLVAYKVGGRIKSVLNYAPNRGQTKKIIDFKVQLKLLLIRITLYKRVRNATTFHATGSYENAPGGYFDVESLADNFLGSDLEFDLFNNDFLNSVLFEVKLRLDNPNFSFIPVKSSLAYSGPNPDLYENFADRDLMCSGDTPLDSYFTSAGNSEHIILTEESAEYMRQEILGNPQPPNLDIENEMLISGPATICGEITVYTLEDCTPPEVNWSVSNSLEILDSSPNSVTVRQVHPTTTGPATITASFNGQEAEKEVWIGANIAVTYNTVSKFVTGLPDPISFGDCEDVAIGLNISDEDYAEVWWDQVSNNFTISENGGEYAIIAPISPGNVQFRVRVRNSCGWSQWFYFNLFVDECEDDGGFGFYLTPNPADEEFRIAPRNETSIRPAENHKRSQNSGHFFYALYDLSANLMLEGSFRDSALVDVSKIASGNYVVKIWGDTFSEAHHLIIK